MLVEKLISNGTLSKDEFVKLLDTFTEDDRKRLAGAANRIRIKNYGYKVFTRGLIEFTNYCKNDCYYCGIRAGNQNADRYRLDKSEIMKCCETGYALGFRTFVLQGGEDPYFTDDMVVDIVRGIKEKYMDCAVTLSMGEKSYESYKRFKEAGADRYLLRHETANEEHYSKLHPHNLSLKNRIECLYHLKELDYQVGTGFMVGSPFQTNEHIAEDLLFLKEFQPHMVGIGPFIPHAQTQYANDPSGDVDKVLVLLSIIRIMLPLALLPATTALGTADPLGREKGLSAGANVVMPNLSPVGVRKKYDLYNDKICTGEEAAECRFCMERRVESAGYELVSERGDFASTHCS